MAKPRSTASNAAESPRTATPPEYTRRADAALHPTTPADVLVSRALDQELEWFFTYAEAALHRCDVGMLPSYAALRVLATDPTDSDCRQRALALALRVRFSLAYLPARCASVLRASYSPRRWPDRIEDTWGPLAGIVVRLWCANDPWPPRWGRSGLEDAAAAQLSAALAGKGRVPIGRLRQQADRLLRSAIVAYAEMRARDRHFCPDARGSR
jgi:hypothetical protein